jgi:DNA-binding transcriptional LysR family regulator
VAGYGLSDALSRFRRTYPAVRVSAIEDTGDYLEHLLIGGEIDVGFLITSNLRNRSALQVESIAVSAMRLWLPLGHPLMAREAITLDDIAKEPLIMLSVEEIEEGTSRLLSSLGARPNVAFRTRSVEAVRSLVATGMGLAIMPDLIYRPWSLEGDRIGIRDVSGDLPDVRVGLAWRRGAPLSDISRDFVRLAQSSFMGPAR